MAKADPFHDFFGQDGKICVHIRVQVRGEFIVPLEIKRRFLPPFQRAPSSLQRNNLAKIEDLIHRIKEGSATSIDRLK
jgi:hypothetical protein